MNFKKGPVKI